MSLEPRMEFQSILLFDQYVRALEDSPKIGIVEFASTRDPRVNHTSVSERFTTLERNLGNVLLIPRRLKGAQGFRGTPVVAMRWEDAHDRDGNEYKEKDFKREPGLTPDGEAWAVFAGFVASQYKVTSRLLLQRRGFGRYPFNLQGEVERKGNLRLLKERASAMRHVADLIDGGSIPNEAGLRVLLDESVADRKIRLGREAFRALKRASRSYEQGEPDERPEE